MFSSINKTFGCCSKTFGCSNIKVVIPNFVAVTKPFFSVETNSPSAKIRRRCKICRKARVYIILIRLTASVTIPDEKNILLRRKSGQTNANEQRKSFAGTLAFNTGTAFQELPMLTSLFKKGATTHSVSLLCALQVRSSALSPITNSGVRVKRKP